MCSYAVVVSKSDIISVTCNSLMYEMRVKIHFELAKISAQSQQLQAALDHLNKVQQLFKSHQACLTVALPHALGHCVGH